MNRTLLAAALTAALCFCAAPSPVSGQTGPLTLQDAVDTAVELNRELGASRFARAASRHGVWEARGAYLPQISFNSEVSKSDSELFEFEAPQLPEEFEELGELFDFGSFGGFTGEVYANHFQLSQLVYDRSVIGAINLAHLREEAALWQEAGQRQLAAFDTVSAYLSVLRAKELLLVQQQRLALADRQLETARTNFEVGLRIRTDVLRAQLTKSSAMRDVVSAEIAVERAQSSLNEVMGVPLDMRHEFDAGPLADYNPPGAILEVLKNYGPLFRTAETENPSIKVAETLVRQQYETLMTARGEFYPRVTVGGQWGFREQGDLKFEDEDWSIRAGVQIPIFEGGRRIAKVRRANEELSAEEQRYQNTVRLVFNNVEQGALALQEEHRNLTIAIEAASVAQENHERFLNLYQEGLADSLDVTQALTELVEAETNVVTTRYGYMGLYAQLLYAMGLIPTDGAAYSAADWLTLAQSPGAAGDEAASPDGGPEEGGE